MTSNNGQPREPRAPCRQVRRAGAWCRARGFYVRHVGSGTAAGLVETNESTFTPSPNYATRETRGARSCMDVARWLPLASTTVHACAAVSGVAEVSSHPTRSLDRLWYLPDSAR